MKKYGRKILALAIVAALVFSLGASAFAAEFTDMPSANHWAYKALSAAVDNNLLNGDNNKLNPLSNLKRAEMAAIINRAFGAAQTGDITAFKDVSKDTWYYSDIAKAVMMGAFKGDGAGTMRPENSITRQEAFVVLARAIRLPAGNASALDKFSDKVLVADWAKSDLSAMVAAGYVNGSDGKLNPTGTITRQEFAQVMYNTIKSYISKAGTVTEVADGNIMVNVAGVTLKNLTVKGDLIVGDGVGNGDFVLDNVKVNGRLVVRGGGKNSIKIINSSSVGNIVISKASDGTVRIAADSTSSVQVVYVDDGKDGIIVEGTVTSITVAGKAEVEVKGKVKNVIVTEEANGAVISVASGATVEKLETNAGGVKVSGEGKITEAEVNGDNTSINVVGTIVTVDTGVKGTTTNGKAVEGGVKVIVDEPAPTTGGPSGPSNPTTYTVTLSISDGPGNATDPSPVTKSNVAGTEGLIATIGTIASANRTQLSNAYGSVACYSELRSIILEGISASGQQSTWDSFVTKYAKSSGFAITPDNKYTGLVTLDNGLKYVNTLISSGISYTCTLTVTGPSSYSRTYTVTVKIS